MIARPLHKIASGTKYLFQGVRSAIALTRFRIRWKQRYPHSHLRPERVFPLEIVEPGNYSYGPLNVVCSGTASRLVIGSFCSIAPKVSFIINNEHPRNRISTFPIMQRIFGSQFDGNAPEENTKGGIVIGDDVWICFGATVLDGVKVGQGAIIAAGSVVTKDVPPYSIVAGVPARVVSNRFENDLIESLARFDWSKVDYSFLDNNKDLITAPLTKETLLLLIARLDNEARD